jgi:hypothetical protein
LYLQLFFTIEKVFVAEAHAQIQRLVSVFKMATVFEEYTTEEERSVVRLLCAK